MPAWARLWLGRVGPDALALPLLLIVAAALRLSDLNWDGGHLFHPDERHILMVTEGLRLPFPPDIELLLSRESPLNPKSFAYGSLIFYLLKSLQWLVITAAGLVGIAPVQGPDSWLEPGIAGLRVFGRFVSALFDTGTVYLTYRLGRVLYSSRVGLLAALFVAFSVLHIQLSHFYASDTPMTFFVTLTLLFGALIIRWGRERHTVGAGITAGLALACKVSAAPVLGAVAIAHLLRHILPTEDTPANAGDCRLRGIDAASVRRALVPFLYGLVFTAIVFVLLQPYAIIDVKTFVTNVGEQNNMVRGVSDLPYTRQYINRPAYWYFVENLALFGVGPLLGIAMFAGWAFVAFRALRDPRRADLLLLAFAIPYFVLTGSFHAKFIRYLLPLTPVLALFAAIGLVELYRWTAAFRAAFKPLAVAATVLTIATTGMYALAYQNVYAGEHTAVEASRWIYANVPRGASYATEHWEEGMPVAVRTQDGQRRQLDAGQYQYRHQSLPMYDQDDERKLQQITRTLATTDYIIFFSNRLYGTVPRLPERYPMSTKYYQLLFGEQLGFELVAAFGKYPELAGVALVDETFADPRLSIPRLLREHPPAPVTLNLGRADEAFSVYDHPKVLIFKKVQPITEAEVRAHLQPALADVRPPSAVARGAAGPRVYPSLLLAPAQRVRHELGGTYSTLFDRNGLASKAPLLIWVIAMAVIGVCAVPLVVIVFPRLDDGGLPLARTVGLLATTWFTWIAVSIGGLPGGTGASYLGLVILIALGVALYQRARPHLIELWRERSAVLITGELAFWVPFGYFVLVRMANPDLWHPGRGGEKPMDFAYLMAAIKSTTFPPYDPWFAGGFLNYYYFGQIIVGNLIKISGVIPTTAFNLVVPTLFGLTFAGTFTIAYNLCCRRTDRWVAIGAGLIAGLFVNVIGNLRGPIQLGEGLVRIADTSYQSLIPGAQYVILGAVGLYNWVVGGRSIPIGTDWYWAASRSIQGSAITEFPYFAFLFADLHAHLIALPFTLLAMALAIEMILAPAPRLPLPRWPLGNQRLNFAFEATIPRFRPALPSLSTLAQTVTFPSPDAPLRLFLAALTIGAFLPAHAWDYPTYLGLIAVCSLAPWYLAEDRRGLDDLSGAIVRFGAIAALSYILYLPFHRTFVSFYSGVKPTPEQSDLGGYIVVHGFFLAVLLSYLWLDAAPALSRTGFMRTLGQFGRCWDRFPHLLELRARLVKRADSSPSWVLGGATFMLLALAIGAYTQFAVAGLTLALLLPALWRLLNRRRGRQDAFVLLLLATGLALSLGVEFIVLDGDIGRMNTIFRFYFQIWVMWGIASAVALVLMRDRLQAMRRPGPGRWWAIGILVLLLSACIYPVIATRARVADRFDASIPPTLDGTEYMEHAVYHEGRQEAIKKGDFRLAGDLRAIEWLWDNVQGSPVIAEAQAPLYSWGSRVSIYTGLPTIVGWDWHQSQQRAGFSFMIEERKRDVRTLFSDPNQTRAREILTRYNVRYIYVGDMERAYYPEVGLRKFDDMVGRELEIVYDRDGVKIYRVLDDPA